MSINIVIVSIIISTFVVVGNFATLLTYLQQYSILELDKFKDSTGKFCRLEVIRAIKSDKDKYFFK